MEEYFKAIKQGDLGTVQRITERSGDFMINVWTHGNGDTPLGEAAYYGHFPIARLSAFGKGVFMDIIYLNSL